MTETKPTRPRPRNSAEMAQLFFAKLGAAINLVAPEPRPEIQTVRDLAQQLIDKEGCIITKYEPQLGFVSLSSDKASPNLCVALRQICAEEQQKLGRPARHCGHINSRSTLSEVFEFMRRNNTCGAFSEFPNPGDGGALWFLRGEAAKRAADLFKNVHTKLVTENGRKEPSYGHN